MNWLIHFLKDNFEPLSFICGIFMIMFVFVLAMFMGLKNAGVKK